MNKPSATDWDRVDALTDEQIDTTDVPELPDSFFAKASLRMPRKLSVADQIVAFAQQLADLRPDFFTKKGPGAGDDEVNSYMRELRAGVEQRLGKDYSEKRICGDNNLAVDFFVEEENTILEIALSLRNPNCEFERDILKALMAKEAGKTVDRLIFVAKPGGLKRFSQPSSQAMANWARTKHNLEIKVYDLRSANGIS
jgi:hypothetical protein